MEPDELVRRYAAGERDFSGVDLSGANLAGVNLAEADLSGADLSYANLSRANLSGAEMYDANLYGANLSRADLSRVEMSASVPGDTDGADLSEVDLSGASLRGADLFDINLSGADLSEADLSGADLGSVDLRNASLSQANLSEANLSGAKLGAADLSDANLSGANFQETLYNEETFFPEGFDPVQAGAILEEGYEDSDYDQEYEEEDDGGTDFESKLTYVQQPQSDTAIQAKTHLELKDHTNTMNQSEVLKTARERLDTILLAIDTAKQLGCMDEVIKQALKYQVRKIILEDIIHPYLPSEWRVSDRAIYLEYSPTRTQLIAIGKEAARLYREQYGDEPPKSEEVVDGETRLVKVYSGKAVDLLDTAIRKVMAS